MTNISCSERCRRMNELRLSRKKKEEIENHIGLIESVSKNQNIWGKWYSIVYWTGERIDIPEMKMLTPRLYRQAFFSECRDIPPAMIGDSWRYFIRLLNEKILQEVD